VSWECISCPPPDMPFLLHTTTSPFPSRSHTAVGYSSIVFLTQSIHYPVRLMVCLPSFPAQGNGKIFVSPQGTYFQVKCSFQSTTTIAIGGLPLHDLAECMTACADEPGCKRYVNSMAFPPLLGNLSPKNMLESEQSCSC
jgi:hypothetical protein